MREAPSVVIINGLIDRGAKVVAHDPIAIDEAQHLFAHNASIMLVDDPYLATQDADALLIVTEWKVFRSPDFDRLKQQLKQPVVFDGRNIYEPEQMVNEGFDYFGIGRSNQSNS